MHRERINPLKWTSWCLDLLCYACTRCFSRNTELNDMWSNSSRVTPLLLLSSNAPRSCSDTSHARLQISVELHTSPYLFAKASLMLLCHLECWLSALSNWLNRWSQGHLDLHWNKNDMPSANNRTHTRDIKTEEAPFPITRWSSSRRCCRCATSWLTDWLF